MAVSREKASPKAKPKPTQKAGGDGVFASTTCDVSALAEILGLTNRRIGQLVELGAITRLDHGLYDVRRSIRGYCDYMQGAGRAEKKQDDRKRLTEEKIRWTAARADEAEIKAAIMRGKVFHADAMGAVLGDLFASIKTRVLALPSRLAAIGRTKEEKARINASAAKLAREALTGLADFDPAEIVNRYFSMTGKEGAPKDENEVESD